ncbi:MAG: hypothetical protein J7521_16955 [Caulobacter sp.]|nr:hypothetical protein [Caulobacter sp.]
MLAEAAVILCLTNATDAVAFGQVRDSRFKSTTARLAEAAMTYREPVAQTPFPTLKPGQTDCVPVEARSFDRPLLEVWTALPDTVAASDRKDDAICRLPDAVAPGQKVSFTYRKGLLGQSLCKETR